MRWRRVDPVQTIDAAILLGGDAVETLCAAMARSPLFRTLRVAHGEGWAAVFAGEAPGLDEPILPRIAGAVALYEAAAGWWLPAGIGSDVPAHVETALWRAMAKSRDIEPPAIVLPRFGLEGQSSEADVYIARHAVPFARSALAEPA